jgi:hypothetical protein
VRCFIDTHHESAQLSQEELFRKLTEIHVHPTIDKKRALTNNVMCFICLTNMVTVAIPKCAHTYCSFCAAKMQKLGMGCPMCVGSGDAAMTLSKEARFHVLSAAQHLPITTDCMKAYTKLLTDVDADSKGYNIVTVIGELPNKLYDSATNDKNDWDAFVLAQKANVTLLRTGTESSWLRPAVFRTHSTLFFHYPNPRSFEKEVNPIIPMLSHLVILFTPMAISSEVKDLVLFYHYTVEYEERKATRRESCQPMIVKWTHNVDSFKEKITDKLTFPAQYQQPIPEQIYGTLLMEATSVAQTPRSVPYITPGLQDWATRILPMFTNLFGKHEFITFAFLKGFIITNILYALFAKHGLIRILCKPIKSEKNKQLEIPNSFIRIAAIQKCCWQVRCTYLESILIRIL